MRKNSIKKSSSFISIIVGMFSISFAFGQGVEPVNTLIGDISFTKKFDQSPTAATNDDLRVKTHLAYVEKLLRQKDVSSLPSKLQQRRTHLLDLLHDYWTRGVFPRNYDYKDQRKPCFIDKDGTICAVGYLVEQTAGREAAEAINTKHKYDLVMEMNDEMVDNWINNSGLTKEECAMIQPSYNPPPYCFCGSKPIPWATCVTNNKGQTHCKKMNRFAITGATVTTGETPDTYTSTVSNSTTISILLDGPEKISVRAFDMTGRLVAKIADATFKEGQNEIPWNSEELNPGIYLLQAQSAQSSQTVKLIITE